mgnify:FL=1
MSEKKMMKNGKKLGIVGGLALQPLQSSCVSSL